MATKTKRKMKGPEKDRGPFRHAADYRGALAEFDAVVSHIQKEGPRFDYYEQNRRDLGISGSAGYMWLRSANAMIIGGQRLRRACRRLLIAEYGPRHARRWDGWKLPRERAREA